MARSRKQSGGGGSCLLVIVLFLLVAGGIYYYKTYLEHPPVPPPVVVTPTPSPTPTPSATPMETATPTPAGTPTPTPAPTANVPAPLPPLSQLSGRQLPLRVALTRSLTFPLVFNGQPAGQGSAPAGAMVRLVAVRSDTLIDVELEQTTLSIPPQYTDIMERVRKLLGFTFTTPTPTPGKPVVFGTPTPRPRPAVKLGPATLLSYDFESEVWPGATAGAFGTVDEAGSKQPSTGLRGSPGVASGPLRVHCHEAGLNKITLAFCLSASAARPITVRVESFDDNQIRTGGLETTVYPAAPDFYQRYAVELSDCKPFGRGTFEPKAAHVGFTFLAGGPAWQGVEKPEVSLDNVHYAVPAFYVSPKGKDTNSGLSESLALETPQKALNQAGPGDIVVLMEGTYDGGTRNVASFERAGIPAAWIVLKNYPGQKPKLTTNGWNTVNISDGSNEHPSDAPALAYLEVRGLHIRGEGDVAKQKYPDAMNKSDPRTNTNGIAADGRHTKNVPHHLRIADNLVEFCPGCGIGTIDADWVTVENNICRSNCWPTIYAPSGISVMGSPNFDATDNVYKRLVRNNTCNRNETFEPWAKLGRHSDGNGIILDVNVESDGHPGVSYIGRTLVQSNLCFDNGGSGIHAFKAARVDIINNTAYLNSASKHLEYGQIFGHGADDIRIMNNILVAPVADLSAGEKPEAVHGAPGKNDHVTYSNNIYFGGNTQPPLGQGDRVADPQFVNPSRDPKVADFHLKPSSPALNKGVTRPFMPYADLDGKPRGTTPDAGAYQH